MEKKVNTQVNTGENLRVLRSLRNLTRTDLENKSGISRQSIRAIETGKQSPTLKTLKKLSSGLEIEVEDLIDISRVFARMAQQGYYPMRGEPLRDNKEESCDEFEAKCNTGCNG